LHAVIKTGDWPGTMRWIGGRDKANRLKRQRPANLLRRSQVAVMDRIECAAKQANHRFVTRSRATGPAGRRAWLLANMTIPQYDILLRSQTFQAYRAADMNLVSADTDLRTQAILETVGKPGRRIDHHRA